MKSHEKNKRYPGFCSIYLYLVFIQRSSNVVVNGVYLSDLSEGFTSFALLFGTHMTLG